MSRTIHLKIKIVTLATEARLIRREERRMASRPRPPRRPSLQAAIEALREHRTGPVRRASRHNQLAYGFLRGRPYAVMEARVAEAPDFDEVRKHARRFGDVPDDRWDDWIGRARAHLTQDNGPASG